MFDLPLECDEVSAACPGRLALLGYPSELRLRFQVDLEEMFLDYDVTNIRMNASKSKRYDFSC